MKNQKRSGEEEEEDPQENIRIGGDVRIGGILGGLTGLTGILGGLTDLVGKLQEISDEGETLSETGELTIPEKGKSLKGVYGFTMRTGLGEQQDRVRVEPFGNIKRDKDTGQTVVQEIREPPVDIFEEEDCTLLVLEMPGVGTKDIRLDVRDDVLTISAEKGDKKYRKEVLVKHALVSDKIKLTCNNGVVEIQCCK